MSTFSGFIGLRNELERRTNKSPKRTTSQITRFVFHALLFIPDEPIKINFMDALCHSQQYFSHICGSTSLFRQLKKVRHITN